MFRFGTELLAVFGAHILYSKNRLSSLYELLSNDNDDDVMPKTCFVSGKDIMSFVIDVSMYGFWL